MTDAAWMGYVSPMKRLLVLTAFVSLIACGSQTATSATLPHHVNTTPLTSGRLSDWGGPVLASPTVHTLWWGTTFNSTDQATVNGFLSAFVGSSYTTTANEYLRGSTLSMSYDTNVQYDTSSQPATNIRYSGLGTEVTATYGAANLHLSDIYVVFGGNYGHWGDGSACAWHDYYQHGTTGGQPNYYAVVYVPNDTIAGTPTTEATNCPAAPVFYFGTWGYAQEVANWTAHEILEAVTDSQPCTALATCISGRGNVAWDSVDGTAGAPGGDNEIADLCYQNFANYTLTDSSVWRLQQEWSNAANACV